VAPSGPNLMGNPVLIKPEMALRLHERRVNNRILDQIGHDRFDQAVIAS
jgi:hypothetical protein